ncbi:MAG: hypothetical protein RR576_01420 [Oscillospiraceae bacterium]
MNGNAYIYIGHSKDDFPLAIPYPTVGNANFDVEPNIITSVNARGVTVGQKKGEDRISQKLGWSSIDCAKWWEINRFFEMHGAFCFVKYFSHNVGEWRVKRFQASGFNCDPINICADGSPSEYENATFTLTGTGA